MSLSDDLTRQVAERVPQPGFEEVLGRARDHRRRRRTTIASAVAAAAVVGGLTWTAGGQGADRRSVPAGPPVDRDGTSQVDPRLPAGVRKVLEGERLDPAVVSGSGDAVAVLWRSLHDDTPSDLASVVQDGDAISGARFAATGFQLTPVPGGWLYADAVGASLLTPSGEHQALYDADPGDAGVRPGDTVVRTRDGLRLLRDTTIVDLPGAEWWQAQGAYVTPEGRVVLAPGVAGPRRVVVSDDGGGRWAMTHVADPGADSTGTGQLAGDGDHVAYALLGDAPDGSIPVLEVAVSGDGGDTWTVARGVPDGLADLSSLVVAPSGTTYLTTGSHGLVRVDADGNARATPLSAHDTSAFVLDDAVCVVAEAGRVDELQCSVDDGASWSARPLPGFR